MAEKLFENTFLSVLLCILFSSSIYTEDEVCLEETSCLCKMYDDNFIDISPISITKDKPYLTVTNGTFSYYFFPCKDVKFDYKQLNITVQNVTFDGCASGTSICLFNATGQSFINLGTTNDTKFSNGMPKSLIYTRKTLQDVISTIIKLDCTPYEHITYLEVDSSGTSKDLHQLVLFSPHACIKTEQHGLSTGSTLLVLFSFGFGIYLLGGALVLHFLRGARGKEMIPNLDFWVDLPYLVRDGIVFLLNGCNPLSVSTAETYDRI